MESENSSSTTTETEEERSEYDIRENCDHRYLNADSNQPATSRRACQEEPEAGVELTIPVFLVSTVVLPGQSIPLTGQTTLNDMLQQTVNKKFPYIGVLTKNVLSDILNVQDGTITTANVGVLVQINTFTEDEDSFNLVGIARQRFRLKRPIQLSEIEVGTFSSVTFYTPKIEVEVLNDVLLLPFHYDPASSFNRLRDPIKTRYLQTFLSVNPRILDMYSTKTTIKLLAKWTSLYFDSKKVERALEQGPSMFSYWIARNLPMSAEEKMQILLEDNVDYRLLLERLFIKKSSSFGCLCGSEMIMIGDLINLNSEGISCCYVNSHGYVHDLITAKAINNVKFTGHAETEYSWFPGYSWKIMNCSNCNVHVGWKFQSNKLKPAKFYGISRNSIQAVRRKEEQI